MKSVDVPMPTNPFQIKRLNMTQQEKLQFIENYNKAIQDSHQQDEIQCDYCSKVVKKFMAIDVWMITDDNKNVCYECQMKNHIGYGGKNNLKLK